MTFEITRFRPLTAPSSGVRTQLRHELKVHSRLFEGCLEICETEHHHFIFIPSRPQVLKYLETVNDSVKALVNLLLDPNKKRYSEETYVFLSRIMTELQVHVFRIQEWLLGQSHVV